MEPFSIQDFAILREQPHPYNGQRLNTHYDPDRLNDFNMYLAHYAKRKKLFALEANSQEQEEQSWAARAIAGTLNQINDLTKRKTNGVINLRELFPLGIATYAFLGVDRSLGAPLWLSMLFFSWNSYMDLHEMDPNQAVVQAIRDLRAEIAALRAEIHNRR